MPGISAQKKRGIKLRKRSVSAKKYGRYIVVGMLFVLSVLVVSTTLLVKSLTQSVALAFSPSQYSLFSDEYPAITYVVVNDIRQDSPLVERAEMLLLDRQSKKVLVYNVPVNLTMDAPGKYGNESFSKFYALGSLNSDDKIKDGINFVNRAFFKLSAYRPVKYILTDSKFSPVLDKILYQGELGMLLDGSVIKEVGNSVRSDLSMREMYDVASFLWSLPGERIIKKDVSYSYVENPAVFDEEISDITMDSAVARERKAISVLNGTETAGIAAFGARAVGNGGGRVVSISNSDQKYNESALVVDSQDSETVRYLIRTFGIDNIVQKTAEIDPRDAEIARSDITLILGFDFLNDF